MNSLLLNHKLCIWSDFYDTPNAGQEISDKIYKNSITFSLLSDNYLSFCIFQDFLSCPIVSITESKLRFLIDGCSFLTCRGKPDENEMSQSEAGGIYFQYSKGGECVLNKVCGHDCVIEYPYTFGQFACISLSNDVSKKNFLNWSSVVYCRTKVHDAQCTVNLEYGNVQLSSTNISQNECAYFSASYVAAVSGIQNIKCIVSYSTFTKNHAGYDSCLSFKGENDINCRFDRCNIIENSVGKVGNFIIEITGNIFAYGSCIMLNGNKVFRAFNGKIEFDECTIEESVLAEEEYREKMSVKKSCKISFVNTLNHFETQKCVSIFDSAGSITPNIPTEVIPTKRVLPYSKFLFAMARSVIILFIVFEY